MNGDDGDAKGFYAQWTTSTPGSGHGGEVNWRAAIGFLSVGLE